jgi:hypothetical protein
MMAMSVVMAVPAVADDGRGERLEERVENRIDNLEDRYEVDIDDDVAFIGNPFLYYGDDDAYEEVLDEVFDLAVDLD